MRSILHYILLSGIRDRLYLGLFITLAVSFSISIFLGQNAITEQQQMTTAFIAGSSRAILAIGMILFVCININRAFENREVEFIISKPISREKFILAYLIGFLASFVLILLSIITAISILAKVNFTGLAIWSLTLLLEMTIIITFALLASLILKNSFSAILASFGFYAISRMMGVFVMAIKLPEEVSQLQNQFLASILKIISVFFPRLDLFTQSKWIAYGINDFAFLKIVILQSAIYIPLMIFMAFHDFKKKQF